MKSTEVGLRLNIMKVHWLLIPIICMCLLRVEQEQKNRLKTVKFNNIKEDSLECYWME